MIWASALWGLVKPLAGNIVFWLLLALAAAGVWGKLGWQSYTEEHDKFVSFESQVKSKGEEAKSKAEATAKANQTLKESNDAIHAAKLAALNATVRSLRRDADSRGSGVPAASPTSRSPNLACFDRAELERAFGVTLEGLRRLADEGSARALDLEAAKAWAAARQ